MNETNFISLDSLNITQKTTPPKTIKILIVEDDPIQGCIIKSSFESLGIFDIILAASAEEAIQLFSENFDLIMTDFNLPDKTGAEIASHYRNIFPKKDTPIICCSSEIQLNYQACINAEINGFLSKPFSKDDLLEILECWLPNVNFRSEKFT